MPDLGQVFQRPPMDSELKGLILSLRMNTETAHLPDGLFSYEGHITAYALTCFIKKTPDRNFK